MKKKSILILFALIFLVMAICFVHKALSDAKLQGDAGGVQKPIQNVFYPAVARRIVLALNTFVRSDSLTTNIVEIYSPYPCHYNIGNYTVRADSTCCYLPAGESKIIAVNNFNYISAKGKNVADTLYITEMH